LKVFVNVKVEAGNYGRNQIVKNCRCDINSLLCIPTIDLYAAMYDCISNLGGT